MSQNSCEAMGTGKETNDAESVLLESEYFNLSPPCFNTNELILNLAGTSIPELSLVNTTFNKTDGFVIQGNGSQEFNVLRRSMGIMKRNNSL